MTEENKIPIICDSSADLSPKFEDETDLMLFPELENTHQCDTHNNACRPTGPPTRIEDWFSQFGIDQTEPRDQMDFLYYERNTFCTDTKPDVGHYTVLQWSHRTNSRVTCITEYSNDILIGHMSGHLYLLSNYKLAKRVFYNRMPGPVQLVDIDSNGVIATSGPVLRWYELNDGTRYHEIAFPADVIALVHIKKLTVVTEDGMFYEIWDEGGTVKCNFLMDTGNPIHQVDLIYYQGIWSLEEKYPVMVNYRNWFALLDIGNQIGNIRIMRKFMISDLDTEVIRGHNYMLGTSRYIILTKRVKLNSELICYNASETKLNLLAVEGLTEGQIRGLYVKGGVLEMAFNCGLLAVSLTSKRVEVYNACSLLKHHVFIMDDFVTALLIVDNILLNGTMYGTLFNARLGDPKICHDCKIIVDRELQEESICYVCSHMRQVVTRRRSQFFRND